MRIQLQIKSNFIDIVLKTSEYRFTPSRFESSTTNIYLSIFSQYLTVSFPMLSIYLIRMLEKLYCERYKIVSTNTNRNM